MPRNTTLAYFVLPSAAKKKKFYNIKTDRQEPYSKVNLSSRPQVKGWLFFYEMTADLCICTVRLKE
jgi:hypothetical protein